MGDTGPCGPCSELHVNLLPGPRDPDLEGQKAARELVNSGDARCIEIWNLVFIQFNANPDGTFTDLPARHVDTGMGFERIVSILQGTKGLTDFTTSISNYDTDVFQPLFNELEKLTGKTYSSSMPASAQNETEQEKIDVAFRVIADHIRTLSFSIADGIQPSNEGRGYVLRRILRRAVRYGRNLGLREPFLGKLVAVLGTTMGRIFPEVVAKADLVRKTLTNEEESFFRTLERGLRLFEEAAEDAIREAESKTEIDIGLGDPPKKYAPIISGESAFELYDTYGFPFDLTELIARERGMWVDADAFNELMARQKARGRAAQNSDVVKIAREYDGTTEFVYDVYSVKTVIRGFSGERVAPGTLEVSFFVPEATPLYPAMGGQVGDKGSVEVFLADGKSMRFGITGVERIASGAIFHDLERPTEVIQGLEIVRISVDEPRRAKIEAHHSGTHLLNWALRKVLGNTITQKGSYVGPDRLRFDFSHGAAMTPAELAEVERLVNEKINEGVPVKWEERAYAEVKGDPGILQFFGDKYGDTVRVVSIGDFSKELCGGTHVRQSGKVGFFKILHEAAIAAGIRRIEAASGLALTEHVREQLLKQEEHLAALRQRKTDLGTLITFSGDEAPHAFWKHWEAREAFLRQAAAEVAQHEKDEAKRQEAAFQKRAVADAPVLIAFARTVNNVPFLAHSMVDATAAYLPVLADALKTRWQGVAILAAVDQGKVALLAAVAPAYAKKIQAGKIIQAIAPLVGGKGGGRTELAQGGGTNPEGVAAALAKAEELVRASL
jgi:alanyl-tRNA synthetase